MTHAISPRRPDREKIPRVLVRAMFGVCLASLLIVSYARLTDRPLEATPPDVAIVKSRTVFLHGDMNGSATVLDQTGSLVASFDPTKGGFVAGMWRVLDRERGKIGLDAASGPVELRRYADGRLGLFDPMTGWKVEIVGFGRDNAATFASILDQ
jgi:putative photosynthetic complex assembly protein